MIELIPKPSQKSKEALRADDLPFLPKKRAQRPTFLERWPSLQAIYHKLVSPLRQAPIKHFLRADSCESEIRQLYRDSLMLAVARYIKEHPDFTNLAQNWLGSNDASKWSANSIPEIEHKALQIWEQVDKWDELAKTNHPEIWEEYKLKPFNVQLNLESALSGSFHVAMGELAIFLDVVGEDFEKIHLF